MHTVEVMKSESYSAEKHSVTLYQEMASFIPGWSKSGRE